MIEKAGEAIFFRLFFAARKFHSSPKTSAVKACSEAPFCHASPADRLSGKSAAGTELDSSYARLALAARAARVVPHAHNQPMTSHDDIVRPDRRSMGQNTQRDLQFRTSAA